MIKGKGDFKPDFDAKYFWDMDFNKIDWEASYKTIITRILERGFEKEWEELIRFYGHNRLINALRNEIIFLPEYAIEDVATYFHISKEEMKCYTRKQLLPKHWI